MCERKSIVHIVQSICWKRLRFNAINHHIFHKSYVWNVLESYDDGDELCMDTDSPTGHRISVRLTGTLTMIVSERVPQMFYVYNYSWIFRRLLYKYMHRILFIYAESIYTYFVIWIISVGLLHNNSFTIIWMRELLIEIYFNELNDWFENSVWLNNWCLEIIRHYK